VIRVDLCQFIEEENNNEDDSRDNGTIKAGRHSALFNGWYGIE
jgi:hypothetical protein